MKRRPRSSLIVCFKLRIHCLYILYMVIHNIHITHTMYIYVQTRFKLYIYCITIDKSIHILLQKKMWWFHSHGPIWPAQRVFVHVSSELVTNTIPLLLVVLYISQEKTFLKIKCLKKTRDGDINNMIIMKKETLFVYDTIGVIFSIYKNQLVDLLILHSNIEMQTCYIMSRRDLRWYWSRFKTFNLIIIINWISSNKQYSFWRCLSFLFKLVTSFIRDKYSFWKDSNYFSLF